MFKLKNKNTIDGLKIVIPEFITVNKFDDQSSKQFREDFQKLENQGQKIIPIYVDSNGGNVDSYLSMYDIIRNFDGIVMTIGNGKCYSCGALLLAAGTSGYRYASKNCDIMLHDISTQNWGKKEQLVNDTKQVVRYANKIYKILDKDCGKKKGYFKKKFKEFKNLEYWFQPKKAKKLGIIDKIGLPNLEFNVEQTIKVKSND